MENADALDLSKENIHPLKGGRNTTQLGLALQAQSDAQAQHMLLKTQEIYEQQIRMYQGSDPLHVWCDYISWIEQSFPKQGPEGNLHIVLQKCYMTFRGDEKYKNDIRFVRLCIRFAETQVNFKECFTVFYNEGIGRTVTEFYLNWAYRLQLLNDWNIADEIFQTGMRNMAQPADELLTAYKRFLSMRDNIVSNNGMQEEYGESLFLGDQRQPMAALKSVSKKGLAPHVRVGSNVRSHVPGTLPGPQGPSSRPTSSFRPPVMRGNNTAPVPVYQERGDSSADFLSSAQNVHFAGHIPQTVNKENEKKPGPWTNQGLGQRKHQSSSGLHQTAPRLPGFEVHKDEDSAKVTDLGHGIVIQNALQPRKGFEDGFHDAMCIFEEPNPNERPMYPKSQVYAGGKEFQLEELRALKYFERRNQLVEQERAMHALHQTHGQTEILHFENVKGTFNHATHSPHDISGASYYMKSKEHVPSHSDYKEFHAMPSNDVHCVPNVASHDLSSGHLSDHHSSEFRGHTQLSSHILSDRPENHSGHLFESFLHAQHQLGLPALTCVPGTGQGMCLSSGPNVSSEHAQILHSQIQTSRPVNQSLYNQSMTVHTKLAMNEVGNLWESPCRSKCDSSRLVNPTVPLLDAKKQSSFKICQDDTLAPSLLVENSFQCGDRPLTPEGHFNNVYNHDKSPSESLKISPLRLTSLHGFDDTGNTSAHVDVQLPSVRRLAQLSDESKMETACAASPDVLFHDPPTITTYLKKHPALDVYSGEQSGTCMKPAENFQVFCDEEGSPCLTRTSVERDSSTSLSIHKIAKEKENMHKFPQADFELMEECGVAPVTNSLTETQHMEMQHQVQAVPSVAHENGEQYQPLVCNHANVHHPNPQALSLQPSAKLSIPQLQEPMEDDVTVSAPHHSIDMSESCVTQAFFYPNIPAASTPFRNTSTSKKSPKSKKYSLSPTTQQKQSEEPVKTVPPLKLYRIRDSIGPADSNQLSIILETSKEKHGSTMLSACSTSNSAGSRYAMYTTQRQSIVSDASQPNLSLIRESSEPLQPSIPVEKEVMPEEKRSMSDLTQRLSKGNVNPFDSKLLGEFLFHMGFPLPQHVDGYFSFNCAVPSKRNNVLNFGVDSYNIVKALGEGAYAKVLKGVHLQTQREVALKIQKPSCKWEFYICREIRQRLSDQPISQAFMRAEQIYVYNNGSVIVTELLPLGTLLNLVNKVAARTKRPMQEPQVLFLVDQLISAVAALHKCQIIHGDLKPDNVLLRTVPSLSSDCPCIQLIDFGRSIDMSLMPPGTTFNQIVLTDTFTCIEMQTGRPWTYQTDLYGLANIAHCLLLGGYMKVQESRVTGRWTIQTKLPRSYSSGMWPTFFDALLNIESCDVLPDLEMLQAEVQSRLSSFSNLGLAILTLGNLLMER